MKKLLSWLILLTLITGIATAQPAKLNLEKGIALEGYDAVSYFHNEPVKGKKELALTWQGAVYYFSDKTNQAAFRKNPEKYMPQYGGWCAYAMGNTGEKVTVDPETYKIIDGRLYLYYNHLFNNTLKLWNKDEQRLKRNADANWQKLNQ